MKSCSGCGAGAGPDARFCPSCGRTMGGTAVADRTLPAAWTNVSEPAQRTRVLENGPGRGLKAMAPTRLGARTATGANQLRATAATAASVREQLIVLIDTSGSMDEPYSGGLTKLQAAQRAAITLILDKFQLDPQDEIGLAEFTDTGRALMQPAPTATHKAQMFQALQGLRAGGGTDLEEGLRCAADLLDWTAPDVTFRIVMLTDGHGGNPIKVAEWLRGRGVVNDVIGVGASPAEVDERLLRRVASTVNGELRYRFITDTQALVRHFTTLAQKTRTNP